MKISMKKYYVEYLACGGWAVATHCVVVPASDLRHLHKQLIDGDLSSDVGQKYRVQYYSDIEPEFKTFIRAVKKGRSNVTCIVELDEEKAMKTDAEIVASFREVKLSGLTVEGGFMKFILRKCGLSG
jgi:hypothetical protein